MTNAPKNIIHFKSFSAKCLEILQNNIPVSNFEIKLRQLQVSLHLVSRPKREKYYFTVLSGSPNRIEVQQQGRSSDRLGHAPLARRPRQKLPRLLSGSSKENHRSSGKVIGQRLEILKGFKLKTYR
jgi:hypothetical protein